MNPRAQAVPRGGEDGQVEQALADVRSVDAALLEIQQRGWVWKREAKLGSLRAQRVAHLHKLATVMTPGLLEQWGLEIGLREEQMIEELPPWGWLEDQFARHYTSPGGGRVFKAYWGAAPSDLEINARRVLERKYPTPDPFPGLASVRELTPQVGRMLEQADQRSAQAMRPDQREALRAWIQDEWRTPELDEVLRDENLLTALPRGVSVWRGQRLDEPRWDELIWDERTRRNVHAARAHRNLTAGDICYYRQFLATSADPRQHGIAHSSPPDLSDPPGKRSSTQMLKLELNPARGLYVGRLTVKSTGAYAQEDEFIIPPGSYWECVGVRDLLYRAKPNMAPSSGQCTRYRTVQLRQLSSPTPAQQEAAIQMSAPLDGTR